MDHSFARQFTDSTSVKQVIRSFPGSNAYHPEAETRVAVRTRAPTYRVIYLSSRQKGAKILGDGEYAREWANAHISLLHILGKAQSPVNIMHLPLSWSSVTAYSDMICSTCGELKDSMQSIESWLKVVPKSDLRPSWACC